MIKDLIKNYFKKNSAAIIIVAIVAIIIVVKFALPLLAALGIIILCLVAWNFLKPNTKVQNGEEKSEDVQIKKD
jgi:hypothetical protein